MSATVSTHSRFGANVEQLRQQGIDIDVAHDMSDIVLHEPGYGETLIGELTDEERTLYAQLYRAQQELEVKSREYVGAAIESMGHKIRSSDPSKPLNQAMNDGEVQLEFGSEENRLAYFRLQQTCAVLHANLYWSVGERLHAHDWSIGVRSRWRVVKVRLRG